MSVAEQVKFSSFSDRNVLNRLWFDKLTMSGVKWT